ncbi:hypothetical protein MC885_002210 [Smutsia gigantea]|nr:hypothetical protein MC885_002210 [Smutsia gigantea]
MENNRDRLTTFFLYWVTTIFQKSATENGNTRKLRFRTAETRGQEGRRSHRHPHPLASVHTGQRRVSLALHPAFSTHRGSLLPERQATRAPSVPPLPLPRDRLTLGLPSLEGRAPATAPGAEDPKAPHRNRGFAPTPLRWILFFSAMCK